MGVIPEKKILLLKNTRDIIPPEVFVVKKQKHRGFVAGKLIAITMIGLVVLLPAFPTFAQFLDNSESVTAEGSMGMHTTQEPVFEEASSSQALGSVATSSSDNLSIATSTQLQSQEMVEAVHGSEESSSSAVIVNPTITTEESIDINMLRSQIKGEIESEFRSKVATGEFQDQIRNEITERIRQGCLEFEDGSFYCIKNSNSEISTSTKGISELPLVFLEKGASGEREVFLNEQGVIRQISSGARDVLFPVMDLYGNTVTWQALIDGKWRIEAYNRATASTTELGVLGENNMNPQIQKDVIVWQAWVDNNWEIFLAEPNTLSSSTPTTSPTISSQVISTTTPSFSPETPMSWRTKRITTNGWHDMFPRISNGFITWQAYKNGVWQVFMYNIETGISAQLSQGGEKSENPRFVVLWDKRNVDGDVQTFGYDMTSGEEIVVGKHEDKTPFKDLPETPLQENKGIILSSSVVKIKNSSEEGGGE